MTFAAIARRTLKVRPRRGGGVSSYFAGDLSASESGADSFRSTATAVRTAVLAAAESGSDVLAAAGTVVSGATSMFPLRIASGGRYLETAQGTPFLLHGDTPWSLEVQLTRTQIDTYLNDRQAKGFTAVMFEVMEHQFSDNNPRYRNRENNVPFSPMTDFASPVEAYFQLVDYCVAGAKSRGMAVFLFPAYLGFGGGGEGWMSEVTAASAASLQTYGSYLAARYTPYGNVIWCMGGDYAGTTTERAKQWNIATGIRSVNPNAIITAHGARTQSAMSQWSSLAAGVNFLNNIYTDGTEFNYAATEYARTPAMPFFLIEGRYENEGTITDVRRQPYASILSGAFGHFYGNAPVWDFGSSSGSTGGVTNALNHLSDPGAQQMVHVKSLFSAYAWHLLQPKTDASLVTTSLGSGTDRIIPARASDGSFAMVYVPGAQTFTINKAALAPSSIRASWYDPTTGTYTAVSGSPFTNVGTQSLTSPGERVLVLDAQPSSGGGGGSGDLVHGQTFTVSGSGFGTKTASAPTVWDNCSHGQTLKTRWTDGYPNAASAATNLAYRTPAALGRGVALPHNNITAYLCGSHASGGGGGSGANVIPFLTYNKPAFPYWSYWSWRMRFDPAWVFAGQDSHNLKIYAFSTGDGPYNLPLNWYAEFHGPRFVDLVSDIAFHCVDDSSPGANSAGTGMNFSGNQGGGSTGPNPLGWHKYEAAVRWSNVAGQGRFLFWYDNKLVLNFTSGKYTDGYAGTQRTEGPGGYAGDWNPNNWQYMADIYHDRQANPGRFLLTNHATYASATIMEPQPYTSWSDGAVTLTCNKGALPSGTVHLHYRNEETGAHQYLGTRTMA